MPTPRIAIRMDPELRQAIDAQAGEKGRTEFIIDAVREKLGPPWNTPPDAPRAAANATRRGPANPEVEPRFKR